MEPFEERFYEALAKFVEKQGVGPVHRVIGFKQDEYSGEGTCIDHGMEVKIQYVSESDLNNYHQYYTFSGDMGQLISQL